MTDAFPALTAAAGREPLSMAVARRLRTAIVSGELADGTPLPSEKDLASTLGVGRSTVREALRVLQAQGLVTGGDTVSTRGPSVDGRGSVGSAAAALEALVLLGQVPPADLVELRLLIEQSALATAARVQGPDRDAALDRAAEAIRHMQAADGDPEVFHTADVAFHEALIGAAGNQAFALVTGALRDATARHLLRALRNVEAPALVLDRLLGEHRRILAAVRAGHGRRAAALVHDHIAGFYGPQLAQWVSAG